MSESIMAKLSRSITAPLISFRFYGPGSKVEVYARSRAEAWANLRLILRPGAEMDFTLDRVEVPIKLYREDAR